ncbi:spherulation-specific family 4 protein [Candidatus Nitrososphaera sp. FF02]|uniref:spherulation-specific family 4 protein n=1 Tax=Candidatus Nitrososphaera sp. FF02 TaxID=3398226 RepID=UPI0039ECFB5D
MAPMQSAYAANTLTVNGVALDGRTLNMWIAIQQNGATVRTGFTPLTFVGTTGASYSIIANDYLAGNIFFDHWDNGSTSKTRTLTLNSDIAITAHYRTASTHNLTVNSAELDGDPLPGYYTTIRAGTTTVRTGFTSLTFAGNHGTSYVVSVSDYGSFVFDHWENNSITRARTLMLNSDIAITAFYRDTSVQLPPPPPENGSPSASDDSVATGVDASVAASVLANDSDPDGDTLVITSVTDPANGSAASNGDGTITYTPDPAFTGSDTFSYTVSDGEDSDTATVTVTVGTVIPTFDLAVLSTNLSGTAITGHQVTIEAGGATVHSGTTPQSFAGAAGTYVVSVQDAGNMVFDRWDDGSTTRSRTVALAADATVTALFKSNAPPPVQNPILTVSSADMQGNSITGLYTTVRTGTTTVKTGFTSMTYTGTSGTSYTVTVSDYGSSFFDHWENGSTTRSRTLSMSSDTTVTAYYRKPFITLSPASGEQGALLTVTGSHFSPSSPVTITYDGTSMPGSITTSSAGAFTASFAVPSFSDIGPNTVRAADGRGWNAQAVFQDTSPPDEVDDSLHALLPKTGVFVALYMYPGSTGSVHWQKVIDEKNRHPSVPIVVAFNPSSGPGNSRDSNIATWVDRLQDAGIIAIGYTYDDYGTRSLTALKADADKYKNWYNADGLFIDEFTNRLGFESHYRDLTNYAKSLGMRMTMGNPGTDVPPSYIGTVTVINTSEGRGYIPMTDPNLIGAGWVSGGYLGWHSEHDKRNFVVIRYDIDTFDATFATGASAHVGLMYITNGDDSNGRWFHVPPYFSTLMSTLDR